MVKMKCNTTTQTTSMPAIYQSLTYERMYYLLHLLPVLLYQPPLTSLS